MMYFRDLLSIYLLFAVVTINAGKDGQSSDMQSLIRAFRSKTQLIAKHSDDDFAILMKKIDILEKAEEAWNKKKALQKAKK